MKNKLKFSVAALSAFIIGMSVNNFALSELNGVSKIAVVDVQQIVSASAEVEQLKKENQTQTNDIISYIEKARKDVAQTTDNDKKKALEEKYSKELNNKREAYAQEYNSKMMSIQKNILNAVREYAQVNNYDMVIAKDVVLYGGDDITNDLKTKIAAIKPAEKTTQKNSVKKKK